MSNSAAAHLPAMAPGDVSPVATSEQGSVFVPLVDIAGAIVFTPTNGGAGSYALRVPWILVPRGTSQVQAFRPTPFTGSGTRTSTIHVKNKGVHQGNVDVFAWGLSDGDSRQGGIDLRAGGVQSLPAEVCSGTPNANDRCLIFALNTWYPWNSGAENEFDVNVDLNNDGNPDFLVIGLDAQRVFGPGVFAGVPISLVVNAKTGAIVDLYFATASPNSSTFLLPVLASELGRSASKPTFRYWAVSISGDDSGDVDVMTTGGQWLRWHAGNGAV